MDENHTDPAATCVFFTRLSNLRSPSPEKKIYNLPPLKHLNKIETDLKGQITAIARESIVS